MEAVSPSSYLSNRKAGTFIGGRHNLEHSCLIVNVQHSIEIIRHAQRQEKVANDQKKTKQ